MAINFLDNLDLNANQLLDAKLQVDSTAPTAAEGKIWFDSGSAKAFKYYNGTTWVDPAASGATYTLPAASVSSGQAKITLTGSDGTADDVFFQTTTSNTTGTGGLALTANSNSITYNINYVGSSGGYNNVINAATSSTASPNWPTTRRITPCGRWWWNTAWPWPTGSPASAPATRRRSTRSTSPT